MDRSLGAGRLPEDLLVATEPESADAVIAFVRNLTELGTSASPAVDAALRDAIAYIAYPKAGQLDADLNRDVLDEAARVVGSRRGDRMKITLMKTITHLRKFP